MINRNAILELEKFIFANVKERRAAAIMADIMGVLIDVKPTMMTDFSEKEFAKMDPQDLINLIEKLGLKCVVSFHFSYHAGHFAPTVDFSVAKNLRGAVEVKEAFESLWSTMDEFGQTLDKRRWRTATKKIGRLLGYPMTAVKDFLKEEDVESVERQKRMERNRYYAHSAKYEREEFESYDRLINLALEKYTEKSARLLKMDDKKRWTDYK